MQAGTQLDRVLPAELAEMAKEGSGMPCDLQPAAGRLLSKDATNLGRSCEREGTRPNDDDSADVGLWLHRGYEQQRSRLQHWTATGDFDPGRACPSIRPQL